MAEEEIDLSAVAKLTERQQLRYLLSLTASRECAPLSDVPPNRKPTGKPKPTKSNRSAAAITVHQSTYQCGPAPPDCELKLIGGGDSDSITGEARAALKAFKAIADELLPYMRRDAHLHHLIFSRHSRTLLLSGEAGVCGGATFRLLETGTRLVLVVLAIVVEQCNAARKGYGTSIANELKRLLQYEAERRGLVGALLAQVDTGIKATQFWTKQGLRPTLLAAQLLEGMHQADCKLMHTYEGSTPMLWEARSGKLVRCRRTQPASNSTATREASLPPAYERDADGVLEAEMTKLSLTQP
eukprot:109323-Prymnesium_polylepis.1